jgi:hypothetical protein
VNARAVHKKSLDGPLAAPPRDHAAAGKCECGALGDRRFVETAACKKDLKFRRPASSRLRPPTRPQFLVASPNWADSDDVREESSHATRREFLLLSSKGVRLGDCRVCFSAATAAGAAFPASLGPRRLINQTARRAFSWSRRTSVQSEPCSPHQPPGFALRLARVSIRARVPIVSYSTWRSALLLIEPRQ